MTVDWLLASKIERNDIVVALGGGVIGDLVGFAAAILRRGIRFIQCPTSLLAQVDSSVGGKTGINSVHGKNLVVLFTNRHELFQIFQQLKHNKRKRFSGRLW